MKQYTEEEIKFLIKNYNEFGNEFCGEALNRKSRSIQQKCKKLGLKTSRIPFHKRPVNPQTFFDVQSPETAYVLGLLWGDGYISKRKSAYNIILEISSRDFENYLPIFLKTGRWFTRNGDKARNDKIIKFHSIYTSNQPLTIFLIEKDYLIKSQVSPTKILSIIPETLKRFFWLGFLDADGCFYYTKDKGCCLGFGGSYNQDWSDLICLFQKLDINYHLHRYINPKTNHKSSKISVMSIKNIIKFGRYIYGDDSFIGLKRKYDKFLQICERETKLRKKSSIYRGVTKVVNGWQSRLHQSGIDKYIGTFKDEIEAAKQHDLIAKQILGNLAKINNI